MRFSYTLHTPEEGLLDIMPMVQDAIDRSRVAEGSLVVFCPHTTAGITINENADPDVLGDMLIGLREAYPDRPEFRHAEGNSAAHLKASAVGASATLLIADAAPLLGRWQAVYFCEFDGPRERTLYIHVNNLK